MVSTNTATSSSLEAVKDGRATRYYSAEEKAQAKLLIIDELSDGTPFEELRRNNPSLPTSKALSDWRKVDEEFATDFAHARLLGFDAIAADCISIIDDGRNDWMSTNDPDNPGYKFNGEHVQRSKLRFEGRMKLLSKWDPKRYGDKITAEITGKDGGAIKLVAATMTPEEASEAYKALMERPA